MPRVNLCRDPRAERQEATRRIIRRGMAEQGIRYDTELAGKASISRPSFSRKMKECSFSLDELSRICKTLRLTPDDAAVMLGIKK